MRYHAEAIVRAPADDVTAQMWASEPKVEDLGAIGCRVTLDGDHLESIAFQLIWLGAPFEVEEPADVDEYLAVLSRRLSRESV